MLVNGLDEIGIHKLGPGAEPVVFFDSEVETLDLDVAVFGGNVKVVNQFGNSW